MKKQKGFTLIEMLIVVAIIGILAAIAIPGLLRARISANEAATIGDIRTVISAQATYASANGQAYESAFTCLAVAGGCVPGAPANSPTYLDSLLASLGSKNGYNRSRPSVGPAPAPLTSAMSPTSVTAFVYAAVPRDLGRTGVRGFAGDSRGLICSSNDGSVPPNNNGFITMTVLTCEQLR